MRDIKFRIWNGESIEETIIDFNIDKGAKYKEFYIYPDDVFMQYTGLKDRNGVEIYEGDIISCRDKREIVEYGTTNGEVYGYHFLYEMIDWFGIYLDYSDLEVIGNIYENIELLRED